MAQKKRSSRWRVWHRWLSLIFGVQMVVWALSGAYMVFFDLDYIHGDHLVQDISQPLPEHTHIASLDELFATYPETRSVSLETRWLDNTLQTVYKLETAKGSLLVNAESLRLIELNEQHIKALANRYYAPEQANIESVVYMTDNPPTEISEKLLPVWQVNYDDFGNTSLYLSETTGDLLVKRHNFWRGFDIAWMLHIMDYEERVDIETWWLKGFIIGTFILMVTGIVLLVYAISFKRTPAGGSQ
ncbi:hypothetical protein CEW91_04785 [Idiomarina piscisalsi]|uniref:PepSY domain-containing protein n=1 Tax=Idiomarina piscisalsi TaxID=1096243 RepID=A0ABM6LSS0_9GAMM|nr:PepSY domain-containing protein [Idiomarina piscisalsi]ASG65490.1 hypothetical protein CEW91_04785 [Idiomarina piscisalsi]